MRHPGRARLDGLDASEASGRAVPTMKKRVVCGLPVHTVTPVSLIATQRGGDLGYVRTLAGYFTRCGWNDAPPIVVNKHGRILDGHHRRDAALAAGLATVEVVGEGVYDSVACGMRRDRMKRAFHRRVSSGSCRR